MTQPSSGKTLRVLVLHNTYQQAGGEDAVARHEAEMLERCGHEVVMEVVSNDAIRSLRDKVSAVMRSGYNPVRSSWMNALLDRVRPDIVHIHNFFPLLTFAVHEAASQRGVPVIQTLHNYRLVCANGTFERDGEVCELCISDHGRSALRHRCYRNSLPGTAAVVAMQHKARKNDLLARNVDTFIAVTQFARNKYIEGGLPADKLIVKPNFVDRPTRPDPTAPREGALFVGRLSHEKGVTDLIEAWHDLRDIPLTIAGDGPLRAELQRLAPANVRFLGRIDAVEVERQMRAAKALVIPSIWYEGFPVTLVEAFASGLPAIATRIGSLAEVVVDGDNGFHCEVKNAASLRNTVLKFFAEPETASRMSIAARASYEAHYAMETNAQQLIAIYESALERRMNLKRNAADTKN